MAKTVSINMRVEPSQQWLVDRAARLMNKDRSTFIMDVVCREAIDVLLDQRLFTMDDHQAKAFDTLLTEPVPNDHKLAALLTKPAPWE